MTSFDSFRTRYGPSISGRFFNTEPLEAEIYRSFGIAMPDTVRRLWLEVGEGWVGENELYFLGPHRSRSIVTWNNETFWREAFPPPREGGPFFFAETCFGDQIGFRYGLDGCKFVLFVADSYELFVIAERDEELPLILAEQGAMIDETLATTLRGRLGIPQSDEHFTHIVSPLVGGTDGADNFILGPARAHLIDAIRLGTLYG